MTDAERPYLDEALQSALAQQCECEVIVALRDGSAVFDDFPARYSAVRFVRLVLAPPGIVRNELVKLASSDWVAFLDGDDLWAADKLVRQLALAERAQLDFVGTDHLLVNEINTPCAYNVSVNFPMMSSWLVRREMMLAHPFSDQMVREDGDWWRRYSPTIRTGRLPAPLARYRIRETSQSAMLSTKRNKLAVVRLARNPVVRWLLLTATWSLNRLRRSEHYVWNARDWGASPTQSK